MAPIVIRICLRWLPCAGRMNRRSKTQPTAAVTSIATRAITTTAAMFCSSESEVSHGLIGATIEVAA